MFVKYGKSDIGGRGVPNDSIVVRKSGIYLGKKDTESDYYCVEVDRDRDLIRLTASRKDETGAYKMTIIDGTKYFAIPRFHQHMPKGRYIRVEPGVYEFSESI